MCLFQIALLQYEAQFCVILYIILNFPFDSWGPFTYIDWRKCQFW